MCDRLDRRTAKVYVLGLDGQHVVRTSCNAFLAQMGEHRVKQWKKHVYVLQRSALGFVEQKPLSAYHVDWIVGPAGR
jgi:hypothetical protein